MRTLEAYYWHSPPLAIADDRDLPLLETIECHWNTYLVFWWRNSDWTSRDLALVFAEEKKRWSSLEEWGSDRAKSLKSA